MLGSERGEERALFFSFVSHVARKESVGEGGKEEGEGSVLGAVWSGSTPRAPLPELEPEH
jgi:hypothetical protein